MAQLTTGTLAPFSLTRGYGNSNPDPNGTTQVAGGGNSSVLNITGSGVVKSSAGRLCRVVSVSSGSSSGVFSFYDSATTSGSSSSNLVFTMSAAAAGTVTSLDFPFVNGISVVLVNTAGTPTVALSFN